MREAGAIAYAKVNFTLDILDRRPDGYHEIRSIMQTISLADTLHIRLGTGHRGIKLSVDGEHAEAAPVDDTNLVIRAVRAVLAEAGIDENTVSLDIDLSKGIPAQAGLGGGSSDAAAALALTSRFFDLDLPHTTLARLAAGLGSDVPFFLVGGTCLVEGVGEKVTPLPSSIGCYNLVICKPNANVPTALAYQRFDQVRESIRSHEENLPDSTDDVVEQDSTSLWLEVTGSLVSTDLDEDGYLRTVMHNDFEPLILGWEDEISRVHKLMYFAARKYRASRPKLSGSGAAIFCLVDGEENAASMAAEMNAANAGWVTTANTCSGGFGLL